MQNRRRLILGMTATQVIVLVCLGLTAVSVMGYAASLYLGITIPFGTAPVQPAQVPQSSDTPLPTDTPVPSNTPVPPTPTFTATTYASLIPSGWLQYKYAQVEMWLPPTFVKKNSKDDLIYAENNTTDNNGYKVTLSLTNEKSTATDLDGFIQDGLVNITPDATILEKKKFVIGTYEARRLKTEVIINNIPVMGVIYFVQDDATVWILAGVSHYDEFSKWLPVFDQVARTFRLNP